MRCNKYLGLVSGGVASLVLASAAIASSIGPNTLTSQGPGWNSIAFQATSTTFGIRNCSASSSNLIFEVRRQWLFLPSTGTGQKTTRAVRPHPTSPEHGAIPWATIKLNTVPGSIPQRLV